MGMGHPLPRQLGNTQAIAIPPSTSDATALRGGGGVTGEGANSVAPFDRLLDRIALRAISSGGI